MLCSASIIKHIHFTECVEGDNTVQIPLCQIPWCIWLFKAYLRRIVHVPQSRQRHTTERKRERKLKVGMKSFWKVTNFNPEWKKYFAILPEKLCSRQELNILKTPRIRVYAVSLSAIAVATREKGNSVVDAYHQISQCMYVKRLLIQIKVEVSRKQNWFLFFKCSITKWIPEYMNSITNFVSLYRSF